ncbi:tetratricopeptide repeat protein [Micromonospora sp. LOL_024]|uniref:tetratricopeptide repeat protein n=1 Tax=Micromonospora sp. LOL_024 TaxID=3345412 RepID=UPI003A87F383
MPSGFGELTDQAHDLVSAGDLAGAQRLLADALTGADPRPVNATPDMAEAASLHARVLVALGEPHSARGWAAYAYAATGGLHGRSDPRTVAAAATLAAVLHRVGSWSRAARLYQEVIIELTASDGPESLRVLAAHADLATVEYARGQCQVARDRLQDAWELHREVYGDGHASGIKMLARLGSMQRDCGQFAEAHDNLALARELARRHLAPDDPLATQVATLARAAASPDHACAENPPVSVEDPVVPPARVPPAGDAPPTHAPETQSAWHTDEPTWAAPADYPPPPTDYPPAPQEFPNAPADSRAGWSAAFEQGSVPTSEGPPGWSGPDDAGQRWAATHNADEQQHPAEGYHPGRGQQPASHPPPGTTHAVPTPRQPADGPAGPPEDWWVELPEPDAAAPPTPDPYRAGQPHPAEPSAGAAVPPSVVGLTGPPQAPGVYRLRREVEPTRPQSPSRLLPVPVRRPAAPPPDRPNRLVPVVAAGVVVVLLGAAAVIAGVSRVGGGDPTPPAASGAPGAPGGSTASTAPASGSPAVTPGAPPAGLSLRDNRDSVALRWTYPAGAEGPIIVAGGRTGQPQNAFADLPAGTDSFVVYGLERSLDYCFTVAVAWSTDTIARSGEVCTERR